MLCDRPSFAVADSSSPHAEVALPITHAQELGGSDADENKRKQTVSAHLSKVDYQVGSLVLVEMNEHSGSLDSFFYVAKVVQAIKECPC